MSPPINTDVELGTRVALVEKEFSIVHGIFQKFESAIEKMTEVSMSMQKLLAVHDQRLQERERAEAAIMEQVERRRDEYVRTAEKLSQEVKDMGAELRQQVKDELEDLGSSVKASLKEMTESNKEMIKTVEKKVDASDTKYTEMEKRVRDLERWRWLMVGGGAVVGFIIAKWSFIAAMFTAVGS